MAYKMPYPKNVKHPRASANYYAMTHEYPRQNHYYIGCYVLQMNVQHYRVVIHSEITVLSPVA